jgi:hypothetical protein
VKEHIERLIRFVMRDATYRSVYGGTVLVDHGDAVDVQPDDDRMQGRGLSRIPKAAGLLGDESRVLPGLRCLFGFENADPRRPRIVAWEYKRSQAVVFLDGGGASVARVGDLVDVIVSGEVPVVGVAGGTTVIPGSPPTVVDVPMAPVGGLATVLLPLQAVIQSGAPRVRA